MCGQPVVRSWGSLAGQSAVAADVLGRARNVARAESTLRDLKNVLEPGAVPFIVLKGAHLGAVYYSRPEDRAHQDVDILVRPQDFDRACELFSAGGLQQLPGDPLRPVTEKEFYCHAFVGRSGLPVEVHRDWAGHGRYPLDYAGVFERSERFFFGRSELSGLAPEDLLISLCVHMAKGYFVGIGRKHLEDVRAVLDRRRIDWPGFLQRASAARCRVGAYYALLAGRMVCGARVPDGVLAELRPAAWRRWWIERALNPQAFPICRIPQSQMTRIQACLFWPLLDRPVDWAWVLLRFLRVRIGDAVLAHRGGN